MKNSRKMYSACPSFSKEKEMIKKN